MALLREVDLMFIFVAMSGKRLYYGGWMDGKKDGVYMWEAIILWMNG